MKVEILNCRVQSLLSGGFSYIGGDNTQCFMNATGVVIQ